MLEKKDIKKIEYRQDADGNDVVDFVKYDNTKIKVPVADIEREVATLDARIDALQRRRRVLRRAQKMITENDPVAERASKLNAEMAKDEITSNDIKV